MMVSIVGDSISTFDGYNPLGYSVFYDRATQEKLSINSVYDTWWAKVNQYLHAYLCVNNAYSGSRVTGGVFPSASSIERTSLLHTNTHFPDMILIYIGFNDFGRGISVQKKSIFGNKKDTFYDSYRLMLQRIKHNYPNAKIICATLLKTYIKDRENWYFPENFNGISFGDYNDAIRKAAKKERVAIVDLAQKDIRYETLDGSHPTKNGHQTIAQAWMDCLSGR